MAARSGGPASPASASSSPAARNTSPDSREAITGALLKTGLASAVLPRDVASLLSAFAWAPACWWDPDSVYDERDFPDVFILTKELVPVLSASDVLAPAGVVVRIADGEPFAPEAPTTDDSAFRTVFANMELEWGRSYAFTVSFQGHQFNSGGVLLGVGVSLTSALKDVLGWCEGSWAVMTNAATDSVDIREPADCPDRSHLSFRTEGAAFGAGDTVTLLVDLSRVAVEAAHITASSRAQRPPGGRLGLVVNGDFKGVALHCLPEGESLRTGIALWNQHMQATLDSLDDLGRVSCFDDPREMAEYLS